MSLREKLNENPSIITIATLGIIVIAIGLITWQVIQGRHPPPIKVYFTTDDGASFFEGDDASLPPFPHDGKTAYRAYVFTCDGGKTRFVAYIERFTSEARKRIEALRKNPDSAAPTDDDPQVSGAQVKLPRTRNDESLWIKRDSPEGEALLTNLKCPSGDETPEPVEP